MVFLLQFISLVSQLKCVIAYSQWNFHYSNQGASSLNLYILVGSTSGKSLSFTSQGISDDKVRYLAVHYPSLDLRLKSTSTITRRDFLGFSLGVSSLFLNSFDAKAAGLPPEQKPRLCDDACEKELENVWWDYMIPFSLPCFVAFHFFSPVITAHFYECIQIWGGRITFIY